MVAVLSVPVRIAVLWPAAEGRPILLLMMGVMRKEKKPPQPSAVGAENELSTRLLFLSTRSACSFSSSSESSPSLPLMGLLGRGGAVVPVVR